MVYMYIFDSFIDSLEVPSLEMNIALIAHIHFACRRRSFKHEQTFPSSGPLNDPYTRTI